MKRNSIFRRMLPSVLILCVLLLSVIGGAVYAKYVSQIPADTVTITVKANIGSISVWETPFDHLSYALNGARAEATNTQYLLLPGADIEKDSYVHITDLGEIPVYVYLEVATDIADDSAVSFDLEDHWILLDGKVGPNGGKIYYYAQKVFAADDQSTTLDISILKDQKITVSQSLKDDPIYIGPDTVYLKFYAFMYQVDSGDAVSVYNYFQTNG